MNESAYPHAKGRKAARWIFGLAGVWGIAILLAMLVAPELVVGPGAIGRADFFYGFGMVGLAWQIAFLVIASDPVRFRPFMLAGVCEKLFYVCTLCVLVSTGRAPSKMAGAAVVDGMLGLTFLLAWWMTRSAATGAGGAARGRS
jgi:hypothetical protein